MTFRTLAVPEAVYQAFASEAAQLESGLLSDDAFKARRLSVGVHRQRGGEAHMFRVRIPGGRLSVTDWLGLAGLARRQGSTRLHLTLRQDLQIYGLSLSAALGAVEALRGMGLSSYHSGGSTVRNITASALAGIVEGAAFDPYPFAASLSARLSRHPLFGVLPRKFKIGFAGPGQELAQGWLNDLGFLPVLVDGARGFRVTCGGGLGASPQNAFTLEEFLPLERVGSLTEAALEYFAEVSPKDKPLTNRFKFILRSEGLDKVRAEIARRETGKAPDAPLPQAAPLPLSAALWISPAQGDLSPVQALSLGSFLVEAGLGEVRVSFDQRLVIPGPEAALREVIARAEALGLRASLRGDEARLVVCTGPETCNRGLVNSKALARELDGLELPSELHISGCQNGCSQHLVSPLSLQGTVKASAFGRAPSYVLRAGSRVGHQGLSFGPALATLPARRVRPALERLSEAWRAESAQGTFEHWLLKLGEAGVARVLGPLSGELQEHEARDCGSEAKFEVALGGSECH